MSGQRPLAPRLAAGLRRRHRDERGLGLVESLVATALLGIAMVTLMGSLSTLALAGRQAEQIGLAQAASRAQATRLKAAPYQAGGNYAAYYDAVPAGLSRAVTVVWWDGTSGWTATPNALGLQRITLRYDYAGTTVSSLELVKANR